jgi:hypothetical protein
MASVFYADPLSMRFVGNTPPRSEWGRIDNPFPFPSSVLRLHLDGSVSVTHHSPYGANRTHHVFTWSSVFAAGETVVRE